MEETIQPLEPDSFQTPSKIESVTDPKTKSRSNSQIGGSRTTRSRVAPDWTSHEMLTLVNQIAKIESDYHRGLPSIQKWKMISDNCAALGVVRPSNQCQRKWESLLVEFKKIRDWESHRVNVPYRSLENEKKMELGLPVSFEEELFRSVDHVLIAQGHISGTDPDSESELEAEMLTATVDLGSQKQDLPRKRKRGRPKSKLTEMAEKNTMIVLRESETTEMAVEKRKRGRPKSKGRELTDEKTEIHPQRSEMKETTLAECNIGTDLEKSKTDISMSEVIEMAVEKPNTGLLRSTETEMVVEKKKRGRPKSKVTEIADKNSKIELQKSKVTEIAVEKNMIDPSRSVVKESVVEKSKGIEMDVEKSDIPRSELIEITTEESIIELPRCDTMEVGIEKSIIELPRNDIMEVAVEKSMIELPRIEEIEKAVDKSMIELPRNELIDMTVEKGKRGRPKSKAIEMVSEKSKTNLQVSDLVETDVEKSKRRRRKSKAGEMSIEKIGLPGSKTTEMSVEKKAGRPKSKVIEMALRTRGNVELMQAILRGDLKETKVNAFNGSRSPAMLQMESVRQQADDLIDVLGSLAVDLNELTNMVRERGQLLNNQDGN